MNPKIVAVYLCLAVLCGCNQQKLVGKVQDPFGSPVQQAIIQVKGSELSTTSDADGEFALEYAPGSFLVQISKIGYTSRTISLSIQEKLKYPLEPSILWPVPKTGFAWLSPTRSVEQPISNCKVRGVVKQAFGMIGQYAAFVETNFEAASKVVLQPGKNRFVGFNEFDYSLYAVDLEQPEKEFFTVDFFAGGQFQTDPKIKSEGFINSSFTREGDGSLRVLSADLTSGEFVWVRRARVGDPKWVIVSAPKDGSVCFAFSVVNASSGDINADQSSSPDISSDLPPPPPPPPELDPMTKLLIGSWKDENSICTYYEGGSSISSGIVSRGGMLECKLDGNPLSRTWQLTGDKLEWFGGKTRYVYQIVEVNESYMILENILPESARGKRWTQSRVSEQITN